MNLCFVEPSVYGHVWISKRDLYPNFKESSQAVSRHKSIDLHTDSELEVFCNFAAVRDVDDVISNVAFTSAENSNQTDTPWYFDRVVLNI